MPSIVSMWSRISQPWVKRIHFLGLHYIYIATLILVSSGLYYCQPGTDFAYVDALFMATTSSTNTGIYTINLSAMTSWHVTLMMLSSFFGSHIMVSFVIVLVRRYYFSKRFEDVLQHNMERREREERKRRNILDLEAAHKTQEATKQTPLHRRLSFASSRSVPTEKRGGTLQPRFSFDARIASGIDNIYHLISQFREHSKETQGTNGKEKHAAMRPEYSVPDFSHVTPNNESMIAAHGIAFAHNIELQRDRARQQLERSRQFDDLTPKVASEADLPTAGKTPASDEEEHETKYAHIMQQPINKSHLTQEQRYLLGGTEYRALDMLAWVVPAYYFGLAIGCGLVYRVYVAVSPYCRDVLATSNPTGPTNPWLFSFFLSLSSLNNLGISVLDASMAPFQDTPFPLIVSFLLIYAGNTAFPIFLRFTLWLMYRLTPKSRQMRRETFRYLLGHPRRCFTTLFSATRTWWLFIVLVLMTLVEERSLGLFRSEHQEPVSFKPEELEHPPFIKMRRHTTISSIVTTSKKILSGPDFFVMTQIQRQLTSDICWVIVGTFLVCVVEAKAIMAPSPITIASVIYECVSAFANAGGSLGYPNTTTSQCGQYHTFSKVVLIILMYRGRHRDLPDAIDRAVLLPSEQLHQQNDEKNSRRQSNITSMGSND
ncbi:hypothetical protein DFQ30_002093 [Apophysomyces sp. BC1015]|nr:hypothetical protein DFQ30_002093 [Apophysomyces sp. BC1015]